MSKAVQESGPAPPGSGNHQVFLEHLRQAVRQAAARDPMPAPLTGGDLTRAAQILATHCNPRTVVPKQDCLKELLNLLSGTSVLRFQEPMARRTTLRVGGPADCFAEPASVEDLSQLLRFCSARQVPVTMIGRGSNLLVRDGGIRGVAVSLSHDCFNVLEFHGKDRITCGAGNRLKTLAVEARNHGLAGFEFMEGIPGSLGGSLRMNAGAMGASLFDRVISLRHMDLQGRITESPRDKIPVTYRCCPLLKTHIALSALLQGQPAPREEIQRQMKSFSQKRWDSQPAAASAGCIFKNPESISAGRLIDELGLKGHRVGQAMVSDVHGNFIVNAGGATAADVLDLIRFIHDKAQSERGVQLETEVQIIGEHPAG